MDKNKDVDENILGLQLQLQFWFGIKITHNHVFWKSSSMK